MRINTLRRQRLRDKCFLSRQYLTIWRACIRGEEICNHLEMECFALTSGISEVHLLLQLYIRCSVHFSLLLEKTSAKNATEVVLLDTNQNSNLPMQLFLGLSLSPSSPSPQYPPRTSLSYFVARSAGAGSPTHSHWTAGIKVPVRTSSTLVLPSSSSIVPPTGCP